MERKIKKGWLNVLHGLLVIIGLVNAVLTLAGAIILGQSTRFIFVALEEVLAFSGVIFYACRGRKEADDRFFLGMVYALSAIILCVQMIGATNIAFITLMTIAFGLVLVFAENLGNTRRARILIFAVIVLTIIACIVEKLVHIGPPGVPVTNLTKPEGLPDPSASGIVGSYASFWSVPLLASTVGLAYEYRYVK